MKRLILFCVLCGLSFGLLAKDLTPRQLALRGNIEAFLRNEGFVPEIDSDGDIAFKKEGVKYFVMISDSDEDPFYVVLTNVMLYDEVFSKEVVAKAMNEMNLYKGVKLLCADRTFEMRSEQYLTKPEQFTSVFDKIMRQLNSMRKELISICLQ